MFLLIPLIIFAVSVGLGIGLISRKFVYLKKLNPEAITEIPTARSGFFVEFFPEIAAWFKEIKFQEFKVSFLAEFEKLLRKFRLLFLKMETLNSKLIHKVRKTTIEQGEILNKESENAMEQITASIEINKIKEKEQERDPKEEEQELIIEIAKDPKNSELYKNLGKLYIKIRSWEDAYESFKKAVELSPEDVEANQELDKISKKIKIVGEGEERPT